MKKLTLQVFFALLISFTSNSQEPQYATQYYKVLAIEFKYGKADEGTQRGMDLFHKARTMIGLSNMVFKSESGPYDLLVFDPVKASNPFQDDHWENQYKAMIEIMGSEDALAKELESWSELVESQEILYYKQINVKTGSNQMNLDNFPKKNQKIWTEGDRQFLLKETQRTKDQMIAETESLTAEQWHFKPSKDSWSIAQVVEHMGLYERLYLQETWAANNLPPQPALYKETKLDSDYLEWMAEVNPHVAPENAVPLGYMKGKDNLEFFLYGRNLILEYIKNTDKDLKALFVPRSSEANNRRSIHGLFVVHFGHTDRHLRQIERIKADQAYPKD